MQFWQVLAACFVVSIGKCQEVPFEAPSHPDTLKALDIDSYHSLTLHGITNLEYGRYFFGADRPHCFQFLTIITAGYLLMENQLAKGRRGLNARKRRRAHMTEQENIWRKQ